MQLPGQTRAQARSITSAACGFVSPLPTPNSKKNVNLTREPHTPCEPHKREPHSLLTPLVSLTPIYVYIHKNGCGGNAFLMTRIPDGSEKIDPRIARHLNGDPMLGTNRVECETCKRSALPLNLDYIVSLT